MRYRSLLVILAGAGALALGMYGSRWIEGQRRPDPAPEAAALEAAIAEIEAGRMTTPLIGQSMPGDDAAVTFLARRAGEAVPRIVSDVTGWGEQADGTFDVTAGTMTRVGTTEWYALRANVAPRARIEYVIAYGPTDHGLDPHNPRRAAGPEFGGVAASEFVMPGYVPPREFADPRVVPAGAMAESTVESRVLGASCPLSVYTPRGYHDEGDYPVAVVLDSRAGPVSRVLDWLIAHRAIEPVVAVFVRPTSRGTERPTGSALRTFLTAELPAWMASRYAVTTSPARRAIIGISFGARDALDAALSCSSAPDTKAASGCHDDAYGRLGLLIPGRRIGRADLEAIAERRNPVVRVAILAGQYDRANVATARNLRQALADGGHVVEYTEVPEGHSAVTWIHHVRTVLVSLFGKARSHEESRERSNSVVP